jgi:hypothetical protein
MKSVLWIGGWAIPPEWGLGIVREHFPEMTHEWRMPGPDALHGAEAFDQLAGYSLGASLMMRAGLVERALLLAPFVDFMMVWGLGGRVSGTQLRQVRRWLARDALSALNDFYERAGLALRASELPYEKEVLDWGLEQLMADVSDKCAADCRAYVGAEDALLDSSEIVSIFYKTEQLAGVGHDLAGLLQGMQDTHEIF